MIKYLLFFLLIRPLSYVQESKLFVTNHGNVDFQSKARQEIIKASSSSLQGVLDPAKKTYAFKVAIRTFHGFNSALQQEHFNEKYLESDKFPEATFSGKIIEDLDMTIDGSYDIRAKGKLKIHGVEMERIIRSKIVVKNGTMNIETHFSVLLTDHNIKVPKIVHDKIANNIIVDIKAELSVKQTK